MIDKKKFKTSMTITLIIIVILILLSLIRLSFSIFHTDSSGTVVNHIAFYTVEPTRQTQTLKMFEISPDNHEYIYTIDVSNFKNGKTSEVDLSGTLQIKTTTNIPVEYKLYLGDNPTNIIGNKETIQDEDDTYFFKYSSQNVTFTHNVQKTYNYKLSVKFPNTYNSEEYQDLLDTIEITIDVKQL